MGRPLVNDDAVVSAPVRILSMLRCITVRRADYILEQWRKPPHWCVWRMSSTSKKDYYKMVRGLAGVCRKVWLLMPSQL